MIAGVQVGVISQLPKRAGPIQDREALQCWQLWLLRILCVFFSYINYFRQVPCFLPFLEETFNALSYISALQKRAHFTSRTTSHLKTPKPNMVILTIPSSDLLLQDLWCNGETKATTISVSDACRKDFYSDLKQTHQWDRSTTGTDQILCKWSKQESHRFQWAQTTVTVANLS